MAFKAIANYYKTGKLHLPRVHAKLYPFHKGHYIKLGLCRQEFIFFMTYLPTAREGNVFTGVCLSTIGRHGYGMLECFLVNIRIIASIQNIVVTCVILITYLFSFQTKNPTYKNLPFHMKRCFTDSFTVIYIYRHRRQRKSQSQKLLCKDPSHLRFIRRELLRVRFG